MTKTPMIATAIALGVFCTTAQAQFAARTTPVTPNPFAANQSGPFPCGQYDDGTTENALGLTAGGDMGWINVFTCGVGTIDSVETAYGTAMFPGSVTNGANSFVRIYDEAGTDPNGFGSPVDSTATTVVNGDTDILNSVALSGSYAFGNNAGILASADHVAGQFPGPMDQDNPNPNAWVVGSTLGPGTLDANNLANNNVPPQTLSSIGFAAAWLLRVEDTGTGGPGTPVCFGDGNDAPCGCGTEIAGTGGGCGNSLGVGGTLSASGNADTTNDSLGLSCSGVRTQPGLFFQADNTIGGGTGITFGDGIRCCGQNVIRLEIVVPPGPEPATATMGVNINADFPGTISPGDKKCYQFWYRDPGSGNPCGGGNFNLSNAVSVTWS